jgi:hypothetical protein
MQLSTTYSCSTATQSARCSCAVSAWSAKRPESVWASSPSGVSSIPHLDGEGSAAQRHHDSNQRSNARECDQAVPSHLQSGHHRIHESGAGEPETRAEVPLSRTRCPCAAGRVLRCSRWACGGGRRGRKIGKAVEHARAKLRAHQDELRGDGLLLLAHVSVIGGNGPSIRELLLLHRARPGQVIYMSCAAVLTRSRPATGSRTTRSGSARRTRCGWR